MNKVCDKWRLYAGTLLGGTGNTYRQSPFSSFLIWSWQPRGQVVWLISYLQVSTVVPFSQATAEWTAAAVFGRTKYFLAEFFLQRFAEKGDNYAQYIIHKDSTKSYFIKLSQPFN